MFQKHEKYKQKSLFSVENQLNTRQQQLWDESFEAHFFGLIFQKIDEEVFSVLFSTTHSRPNSPINQLVGALILKHRFGWSYSELEKALNFNLLTRMALGVQEVNESIFRERTLFNFQNRLSEYRLETGVNLLEQVFDGLSKKELKRLALKTNIQRGDSFLAASNITRYSRLQLLVEVLKRLHRVLKESDQKRYADLFGPYLKKSSTQYIHTLAQGSLPLELAAIGQVYRQLYESLKEAYGKMEIFEIFERVYQEHFELVDQELTLIPNEDLSSGSLQSPDDREATYRKKRGESSQGFSIHLSETAHPDNVVNLITDVSVDSNNVDDSDLLYDRLEKMKEKTPDLEEYHQDGGYGSPDNDQLMSDLGITPIQTAIRGRKAEVQIEIYTLKEGTETEEACYEVHCQAGQEVSASQTKKKYKAEFEGSICEACPLKDRCPTTQTKRGRTYYFTQADARKHQRWRNIRQLPLERQRIRPNVESTVRQMKNEMKNGKLKTRGFFKAQLYAYFSAIATNAARVAKHEVEKKKKEVKSPKKFKELLRLRP